MRRTWRLFLVLVTTLVYTAGVRLILRFRPKEERPALRARFQQVGTGLLCRIMGVHASMRGTPPVGKAMLCVSNHMGVLDPLVLASQMPISVAGNARGEPVAVYRLGLPDLWPAVCRSHASYFDPPPRHLRLRTQRRQS